MTDISLEENCRLLTTNPPTSLRLGRTVYDIEAPETPGVYAIFEGPTILYVGIATTTRPDNPLKRRMWGLKDRLGSHRVGTLSASSLAIALWFRIIAPNQSCEMHRDPELNPSAMTRNYIREKLSFTYISLEEVQDARDLERHCHKKLNPPLNGFRKLIVEQSKVAAQQEYGDVVA
jgi:hypothetical protein